MTVAELQELSTKINFSDSMEREKAIRFAQLVLASMQGKPSEPIALIDLDGSTADLDSEMQIRLTAMQSPGERIDYNPNTNDPHIIARREMIKNQPGFWRGLKKIDRGFKIIQILRDLNYKLHALSKGPARIGMAWQEKFDWCREHLPDALVTLTEDKGLSYGKVLLDDWPPYIERWLEWRPRGLVISVAQAWNVDIEERFPQNVMRFDGSEESLDRIRKRLAEVRATAG
jgi:5'-nucleotidase